MPADEEEGGEELNKERSGWVMADLVGPIMHAQVDGDDEEDNGDDGDVEEDEGDGGDDNDH